jgi:hypothetical protein
MDVKTVVPLLFLQFFLLSSQTPVVLVAASEVWKVRWNLNEACMPVGEVSKATFGYTSNTDQAVAFVLTADWVELQEEREASLGAMEFSQEQVVFTHSFERGGIYDTSFTAEMGDQKITLKKVCNILVPELRPVVGDVLQADTSATSSVTLLSSCYAVVSAAIALGCISTWL